MLVPTAAARRKIKIEMVYFLDKLFCLLSLHCTLCWVSSVLSMGTSFGILLIALSRDLVWAHQDLCVRIHNSFFLLVCWPLTWSVFWRLSIFVHTYCVSSSVPSTFTCSSLPYGISFLLRKFCFLPVYPVFAVFHHEERTVLPHAPSCCFVFRKMIYV